MHGLLNKAIQGFLTETYGVEVWDAVRKSADLPFDEFEAMLTYDPSLTVAVSRAGAQYLDKTESSFLEDVGTWIVAHRGQEPIRRLLRFGGGDFREFLFSLEELPDRAKMALPSLTVPDFTITYSRRNAFRLIMEWPSVDLTSVVVGALRAMADDYGALVLIEPAKGHDADGRSGISIELLDDSFAAGRVFQLGGAGP